MERKITFFQKKLAFLFPLSIFIMIFDRLKVYPTVDISMYAVLQISIIIVVVVFLLGKREIKFNLHSPMFVLVFSFMLCTLISTLFSIYQKSAIIEFCRIIELVILAFLNKWAKLHISFSEYLPVA